MSGRIASLGMAIVLAWGVYLNAWADIQMPASVANPDKPALLEEKPLDTKAETSDAATENKDTSETAKNDPSETSLSSNDDNLQDNGQSADNEKIASKVLQGYVRVVPSGTKIPIIMDTAIDSDTSQEGDEFSARLSEDILIDGTVAAQAGSVIKGRIAQLNSPRRLNRSGSVALKFDAITLPDNRQIPIVANIVARGGVVHARRGAKDIVIQSSLVALPTAVGLGIGLVAGNASKSLGSAKGAAIGVAVGAAIGTVILLAKKGKRVDVRPGDELKIELAEDLRMPM